MSLLLMESVNLGLTIGITCAILIRLVFGGPCGTPSWLRGRSTLEVAQHNAVLVICLMKAMFPGTLTVEEVYRDRDQFAALVREVAAPDVGRMGIEILSFTIKDVYDEVQYLASLGKAQTAAVKRDADAGVAEAKRDAGIREAECQKAAMDVKYSTDTKIEDNRRMYNLQKANFDQEINTAVS